MDRMRENLALVGLDAYADAFVRHGFESWAALSSATETDFEAVGLKLGHRRKLQRALANNESSSSSGPNSRTELDTVRPRIYRRHPKPDKNAPTRPLTAYVRFSNDRRDFYKDKQWTFTELTRQIGHEWRTLTSERRQHYVDEAETAKNVYRKALWKYRQTPSYHEYARYLEEFHKQNPRPSPGHQGRRSSKSTTTNQDQLQTASNSPGDSQMQVDTEMQDLGSVPFNLCTTFDPPPMNDNCFVDTPASYSSIDSFSASSATMPMDFGDPHIDPSFLQPYFHQAMPLDEVKLENHAWTNFLDLDAGVDGRELRAS